MTLFSAHSKKVLKEVVAEADSYLYKAKTTGRNRILSPLQDTDMPPKLVFFAEDDPLIASVVNHRLKREGFNVKHFKNGSEALKNIKENDVQIFILDVQMPVMDGFELLENIRKTPRLKKTPIIMLTALGQEKDILRGFELGANDYITKPFSPVELMTRVRRLVV